MPRRLALRRLICGTTRTKCIRSTWSSRATCAELAGILRDQFPTASIKLYPTSSSSTVLLSGYVDRPDYVSRIVEISQEYFPKVINNMVVGGSQQVVLYVKVMQVSPRSCGS